MPTQDFIYDLLEKLKEDNVDYLLVTVNKGSSGTDKVELFYEAETVQSEQCMIYCFKKLVDEIQNGDLPEGEVKEIDYGTISQEELDEIAPPLDEEDDENEEI